LVSHRIELHFRVTVQMVIDVNAFIQSNIIYDQIQFSAVTICRWYELKTECGHVQVVIRRVSIHCMHTAMIILSWMLARGC